MFVGILGVQFENSCLVVSVFLYLDPIVGLRYCCSLIVKIEKELNVAKFETVNVKLIV